MTTESLRVARVARVAKVAPRRRRPSALRSLSWAYIIAVIAVTAFPFYWMLRTALSNNYALDTKPSSLLPVGLTLGPFERVFGLATPAQAIAQGGSGASVPFARAFLNSVIYASVVTVCVVFFSTLAAYAFARLEWRGRSIMFRLVLFAILGWIVRLMSRDSRGHPGRRALWVVTLVQGYAFGLIHLAPLAGALFHSTWRLMLGGLVMPQTWEGVVFGRLYLRRGLEASIIAHASMDVALFALAAIGLLHTR